MSFAARITMAPIPYDPEKGQDVLTILPALAPQVSELFAGVAGCSPYLAGLLQKEAAWLEDAMAEAPEETLTAIMAETDVPLSALPSALRQAKRRVALLTALADAGGVWSLDEVTGALTRFADHAVHESAAKLIHAEVERGKLPAAQAGEDALGFVALAMGKMGAGELNYSSDIDLICLFDESQYDPDEWGEARAGFIRVTRRMTKILSEVTGEGYVFRTDLRLRPDSGVTPVAMAMEAAERYYESLGRTWERAAHIKARAAAGDLAAGAAYLDRLKPFVWRRHLDFAAIQDVHGMAQKIRDHKGLGGAFALEGHDVKLGRGGIRQIEFFAQTQQLIFGGRDPSLRTRRTVDALDRLAKADRIGAETAAQLSRDYEALRTLEHRIQMVGDQQTHLLPKSDEGLQQIARFLGQGDDAAWRKELRTLFDRVHDLTELAREDAPSATAAVQVERDTDHWASYPAFRSERAVASFNRIRPRLMEGLSQAADPDRAFASLDSFLSGLPAGVQLFALFEANPLLVDLVVDIAATAPGLASYLSRHASVFDAVIAGEFFGPWPGADALAVKLSEALEEIGDYEGRLDAARRWMKEWHFRVGVHHLRGLTKAAEAGAQYADLAEACLRGLMPVVTEEMARKHGTPPGRGAVALGMGSLGAGRLNATSDLDLIVIYDADGVDASDGKRPLASRAYYARLTQSLVTALSAPMGAGRLYEVDMRLRPSGRQGPVATSVQSFRSYQREEAWTWEHLALTRARPIAGAPDLIAEIEAERRAILTEVKDRASIPEDVADMRDRLEVAKPAHSPWDAKSGRGRAQDIELTAEMLALRAGAHVRSIPDQLACGSGADFDALAMAYEDWMAVQAVAKLTGSSPFDPEEAGAGAVSFLVREFDVNGLRDVQKRLSQGAEKAGEIIDRLIGRGGS